MKSSDWLMLGLIIGAVYLLYTGASKAVGAASSAIQSLTNAPVSAAAQAYVRLTAGPVAQATGSIILPDGSPIAVNTVNPVPVAGSNSATFNYLGQQYFLNAPSDPATGNWSADTFMVQ